MVVGMWIIAFYLLGTVAGKEVCYDRLGCFTDDPPWSGVPGRLLTGLPDAPEHMNLSFSLYTRETGNNSQVISAINSSTIQSSHFSSRRQTSFIIHGFGSTGKKGWVVEMCLQLVEVENINCIAVDWEEGAKGTYIRAVNNIRVIGAEIAYFIKTLQSIFRYSLTKIHLIGHSLGAHTAGEAGRRIQGIRRITGLDPAGPCFEDTPPLVRLDPSDANFVDIIHSNAAHFPALGLGMYNTTGHLDFYPNGGSVMPGCTNLMREVKQTDFEAVIAELSAIGGCHHSRSHEFYHATINHTTGYLGFPCEKYDLFKEVSVSAQEQGKCFPCPQEGCPMMGHYADQFPARLERVNQKYFLNTAADPPFATWRQKVLIKLAGAKKTRGDINLVFHDTEGNTKNYEIASGALSQDQVYTKYLDVEINPNNTKKIEFVWNKTIFTLLWARLGAETVNITHGEHGLSSTFCGQGTVSYGVPQLLTPC